MKTELKFKPELRKNENNTFTVTTKSQFGQVENFDFFADFDEAFEEWLRRHNNFKSKGMLLKS